MRIDGSCACGAIKIEGEADPERTQMCHCTDCQKFTGSAFSTVLGVPKPAVKIEGKIARYSKTGDTGKSIHRIFCPECGSSIADEADALPDVVMLGSGTLDDSSWVKPGMEIFCDSAQSWVDLQGAMKRFPKMPG